MLFSIPAAPFTFSPPLHRGSIFPTPLSTCVIIFFYNSHPNGYKVVYCGFDLLFPDDL